jgi:hypothetical protein
VPEGHEARRLQQLRAPVAQLLLVARLRARNRRDLARDLLERAAQVLLVTCKSWFSLGRSVAAQASAVTETNKNFDPSAAASADPAIATSNKEIPDAYRHD